MAIILQGVLVVGLSVAAALAGQFLVRRWVPQQVLSAHTAVAGIVYATLAVIYGVILGQVVVAAWDDYFGAELAVDDEASALVNLYRLAEGWPASDRDPVQQAVTGYAQDVVDNEWPAMTRGDLTIVPGGYPPLAAVWRAVREVQDPATRDSAEFEAAIDAMTDLENARSKRLVINNHGLPPPLWAALLAGALLTVAFAYLLAVENRLVQSMMVGALAGLLALLLFLAHVLEHPYRSGGIQPLAFQVMLVETERVEPSSTAAPVAIAAIPLDRLRLHKRRGADLETLIGKLGSDFRLR